MEKQKLPNATLILILSIGSLLCCCFAGVGVIPAVIALVLAMKSIKIYKEARSSTTITTVSIREDHFHYCYCTQRSISHLYDCPHCLYRNRRYHGTYEMQQEYQF